MLKLRILSAAIALPLLIGTLMIGGLVLKILAVLVYFLLAYEFSANVAGLPRRALTVSLLAHLCLLSWYFFAGVPGVLSGLWFALIIQLCGLILYVEQEEHQPFLELIVPASLVGLVYPGVLALPLIIASCRSELVWAIGWLLVVAIASDTFAFIAGRAIGGIKLAERISPNKTVAGAIGGFVAAVAAGVAAFWYLCPLDQRDLFRAIPLTVLAALLVQLGDLAESLIKRTYQAKDSGNILPGHGGLFDRIDGLLFASPILVIFF